LKVKQNGQHHACRQISVRSLMSLETRHYSDIASFLLFMMGVTRRYIMRQVFDLMQIVMSPHCLGTFTVIKPTG
jgi:hypothetical protein